MLSILFFIRLKPFNCVSFFKIPLFILSLLLLLNLPGLIHAKTLRVAAFSADVPAIDSMAPSFDPDSYTVITQIFDSLIHSDLDGNFVPGLATEWQLETPTSYIFNLRTGVTFHNGEPFDAHAVKFTYETAIDPDFKAGVGWILSTIDNVEIINPFKVRINLKQEDGMLLFRLMMFGAIVPPETIKNIGWQAFHENPIGTGPYIFTSWKRGQQIVLDKNTAYWRSGIPKNDQLIFSIMPEKFWAEALLSNKIDLVPGLSGRMAGRLENTDYCTVYKRLVLQGYWVLLKNTGPLADVRVRQALNYAINKKKLILYGDNGEGVAIGGISKKGEFGYNPKVIPYEFNRTKAKQLLEQAGYPNGFSLNALSADISANVANYIKIALGKIGVTVNLRVVSRPDWATEVVGGKITGNPYKGDMAINLVDNPIFNSAFHIGLFLDSKSPWALLEDSEFDRLYKEALLISDLKLHESAIQKLDKYIHDQAYLIFTYQRIKTVGLRNNIIIPGVPLNGHVDYVFLSETVVQ